MPKYVLEVCRSCPPDILFGVESYVVRNKEVRVSSEGAITHVCLVCEHKNTNISTPKVELATA